MNMRNSMKFMIAGLILILSIFYPDPKVQADTEVEVNTETNAETEPQRHNATVTIEYNNTDNGLYRDTLLQEQIAIAQNCKVSDIVVIDLRAINYDVKVEYTVEYKNKKTASKGGSFTFEGSYTNDELDYMVYEAATEKDDTIEDVTRIQYKEKKITYEVAYSFWSEEVKQSICMAYGVPYTERDLVAELSPVTVYFQGYRIPYVLEDGGELYIKRDYADSPIVNNLDQISDGYFTLDDSYTYRNYSFKTDTKSGTKIGKIGSRYRTSAYELLERYPIGYEDYVQLSEILDFMSEDDWRDNQLTYDKETKTLYYGRKPTKKEQSLTKDTIYDFVEKAIKGCKTDKEKVTAIHDAIIKTIQYKSDALYYDHETYREYDDGVWIIENAVQALKSKKANEEALAILFQECLRRLFIPCQIIEGKYIWPEDAIWNRVYIDSKPYHIDLANDLKATTNKNNISHKYLLKSADYFMGTHYWEAFDYVQEYFSTSWKSIDPNNIKTTQDLRRAVVYASYVCGEYKHKTYTFKIKSSKVQTDCSSYVMFYNFVNLAQQEYKNGVLTVTFN